MLREHRDGIVVGDAIVQVIAQTFDKVIKFLAQCAIRAFQQGFNAGDLVLRDGGDVIGPIFPVGAGANFIHQLGVDSLLPLL